MQVQRKCQKENIFVKPWNQLVMTPSYNTLKKARGKRWFKNASKNLLEREQLIHFLSNALILRRQMLLPIYRISTQIFLTPNYSEAIETPGKHIILDFRCCFVYLGI